LAWAYIKPVRVIAPEALGLTCIEELVCVDDLSRADEAKNLYRNAIVFVQSEIVEISKLPRAIFCSGKECSSKFGLYRGSYGYAGAYNVGTFGIVISYRGWHPYYVRHELIHHVQNERLGSLNAWFFKPDWFKEGMAYSLSKDPRHPLPDTLEGYRKKYDAWAANLNLSQIWEEAEKL
jgi:hypothetical protein